MNLADTFRVNMKKTRKILLVFEAIKNTKLLYFKGFLFLLTGILAAGLILFEKPNLRTLMLLIITIWAFCRFYYFIFYVIENYTDGEYKFSGIFSFLVYLWRR